jgi:hypothetical protein
MIANGVSTQEAKTKYYSNRDSTIVWNAGVACIGLIGVGASVTEHSLKLTSCLLLGAIAVWYLGYWALSKSCYFISPTKAGFKDAFRAREVQFEEIRSATKAAGSRSSRIIFVCDTRTVTMPLDPIDESWLSAVKTELLKRGVPISSTALGFSVKEE